MSGLFGSLNQTVGALNAQSRGVETAGRNLANVNNPNYARQRVILGDRGTVITPQGAQSLGIEAKGIQQLRDSLLDAQVVREVALTSSDSAELAVLLKAQASFGETIDSTGAVNDSAVGGNGLSSAITEFFNAFQGFAAQPTDAGERQLLVQRAEILTERFQLTDERLGQVQADVDIAIGQDVNEANSLLKSIASINGLIATAEINQPGAAVDLRDKRQAQLESLAKLISFETAPSSGTSGQVDIFVRDAGGNPITLVGRGAVVNEVSFDGAELTAATDGTTIALRGGSVAGRLAARDGGVQELRESLDALAKQLITSVNAAYNPTGTGNNFFAASSAGAANMATDPTLSSVSLNASATGATGDNGRALAVAAIGNQKFSTANGDQIDGTIKQFYSSVVSDFGLAVSSAESREEDQSRITELVRQQRDSVSGVSIDEEMADLLKYQRAFQASSRVLNIIDELLELVVNRLGN